MADTLQGLCIISTINEVQAKWSMDIVTTELQTTESLSQECVMTIRLNFDELPNDMQPHDENRVCRI